MNSTYHAVDVSLNAFPHTAAAAAGKSHHWQPQMGVKPSEYWDTCCSVFVKFQQQGSEFRTCTGYNVKRYLCLLCLYVVSNNILHSAADVLAYNCLPLPIRKSFVWVHYQSHLTVSSRRNAQLLLELLFVQFVYLSVPCLSQADITYAIDSICKSWCLRCFMFYVVFYICISYTIFIINNK